MTLETDSETGRLPDFLVIGAAKSGTTTLYEYLLQHPGIYMPEKKEPCFFDEAVAWKRGLGWYRGLFAHAKAHQICGEASTNYTRWPQVAGVPEKVQAVIPEAKLIYVMRDPVKRAYSHYVHRWSKELHKGEPVSMGFMEFARRDPMCMDSSKYSAQIQQYLKVFPRRQMLLIVFEDLVENPDRVMRQVFRFLGLDPVAISQDRQVKANASDEYLDDMVRTAVAGNFNHHPLYSLARRLLPRSVKDLLYGIYAANSSHYQATRSQYTFPPLTGAEAGYLNGIFTPFNDELRDAYGLDVSKWTLKSS